MIARMRDLFCRKVFVFIQRAASKADINLLPICICVSEIAIIKKLNTNMKRVFFFLLFTCTL